MPFSFGAHSAFFSLDTDFWHFSWSGNLTEGRDLVQMEQLPFHAVLVGIPDSSLSTYTFCAVLYAPFLHHILEWLPSFFWFLREVYCSFEVCSFKGIGYVVFKTVVVFSGILISCIEQNSWNVLPVFLCSWDLPLGMLYFLNSHINNCRVPYWTGKKCRGSWSPCSSSWESEPPNTVGNGRHGHKGGCALCLQGAVAFTS